MAKGGGSKSKKAAPGPSLAVAPADDPALTSFVTGDFARAKPLFAARAADPALSEAQRQEAQRLHAAVALDKGLIYVGLGCLGLLALVIVTTMMTQP